MLYYVLVKFKRLQSDFVCPASCTDRVICAWPVLEYCITVFHASLLCIRLCSRLMRVSVCTGCVLCNSSISALHDIHSSCLLTLLALHSTSTSLFQFLILFPYSLKHIKCLPSFFALLTCASPHSSSSL